MSAVLDLLHQTMSSPWVYAAIFTLALLDAFLPVVPSETAVITAGVFAATGGPHLALVVLAATAGAMAGDHVSYAIGRRSGPRLVDRMPEGSRRRVAYEGARAALLSRGGSALIVSRYVPGGRTAVTLTTGAIRFPRRSFLAFDAVAASSWALYSALVGYIGGVAFEREPVKGVLLGLGVALTLAAVVEVTRHVRHVRRDRPDGNVGRSSGDGTAAASGRDGAEVDVTVGAGAGVQAAPSAALLPSLAARPRDPVG